MDFLASCVTQSYNVVEGKNFNPRIPRCLAYSFTTIYNKQQIKAKDDV